MLQIHLHTKSVCTAASARLFTAETYETERCTAVPSDSVFSVQLPQPGCLQQKHMKQKGVQLCHLTVCSVYVTPTVKS